MLTLVLLPGMDGTGLLFKPFIRALGAAATVRVIAYPVDQPMGYEELRLFVESALPEDAPFVLLAESFAGPIAIQLAAEYNAQLLGVILCCTFARNPRPKLRWSTFLLSVMPMRWVPSRVMSYFLLGRFTTRVQRGAIASAVGQVAPAVMRSRIRAVMAVDVSAQMARIRVPCLYIRAAQDRLLPPDACRYIQRLSPTARETVVNAPHCLLQAAPEDAASVVTAFLQEMETAMSGVGTCPN